MADNTATRESQVTVQCGRLEKNIEAAREELTTLEARLDCVLVPGPEPESIHTKELKEAEELTPHAAFLRRQANSVRRLIDGLDSLRDRIEL